MAQRIDGNQPTTATHHSSATVGPDAPATDSQEVQPEPGAPGTEDLWEEDRSSAFDDVVHRGGQGIDQSTHDAIMTRAAAGEATTVQDLLNGSFQVSHEQVSHEPTEPAFEIDQNPAARAARGVAEQLSGGAIGPRALRSEISLQLVSNNVSNSDVVALAAHPEELRAHLLAHDHPPELADAVVDGIQSQTIAIAGESIASRAQVPLRDAIEGMETLNANSDSRRHFLATIANGMESRDDIEQALADFGVGSRRASSLADSLDELRQDPEAMEAFLAGESSDRNLRALQFRAPLDKIDRQFERELDTIQSGLERLHNETTGDQIRHDQFLTEPMLAPYRDQVFEEMGIVLDGPDGPNELGQVFSDATDNSLSAQRNDQIAATAIMITAGVTATVATGGAAGVVVGGGTGALGATPDVADAHLDVVRNRGAVHADLADPSQVAAAEQDRFAAYGIAAASIVVGAAAGEVGPLKDLPGAGQSAVTGVATSAAHHINRRGD